MTLADIDQACEALRKREGISKQNLEKHIGVWKTANQKSDNDSSAKRVRRFSKWGNLSKNDHFCWLKIRRMHSFGNKVGHQPNRFCQNGLFSEESDNEIENRIEFWARQMGLDAVIWTNLPPKFQNIDGRVPTQEEVVSHLSKLTGTKRDNAERYIRMAPRQIDTDYRQYIEAKLCWLPSEAA